MLFGVWGQRGARVGCEAWMPSPTSAGDKQPLSPDPAPSGWIWGQLLASGGETGTDLGKIHYFPLLELLPS